MMEREELIRLAKECGLAEAVITGWPDELERFAELVAAEEREACAVVCDQFERGNWVDTVANKAFVAGTKECATAIRARGDSK